MRPAIHALRVNIKSLAAEARLIRGEIHRTRDAAVKNQLAAHRVHRLRPESRLAHLALAFLRHRDYRTVENRTYRPVDPVRLALKLSRFPGLPASDELVPVLTAWLAGEPCRVGPAAPHMAIAP